MARVSFSAARRATASASSLGFLLASLQCGVAVASVGPRAQNAGSAHVFSLGVAIEVPAYRGLEPRLSLAYKSIAANGQLGVGWNLGGFSIIERMAPGRGAPRFNHLDTYRFEEGNGWAEEMIPDTSLGGTHSTRRQSFLRISFDSDSDHWIVVRPDGTRLTYEPLLVTAEGTVRWGVASAQDATGNAVTYRYFCDGSDDCYPDTVSYNGTTVTFHRQSRPDVPSFATGASVARTRYRIGTIEVDVSGQTARAYVLEYEQSLTGLSQLASVTEYGTDAALGYATDSAGQPYATVLSGSALPATTFAYEPSFVAPPADAWSWTESHDWSGQDIRFADFDGDGKSDILLKDRSTGDLKLGLGLGGSGFEMWTWQLTGSYEWVFSSIDNNGCNSCEFGCSAACTPSRVGSRRKCRVPGTHNNDEVSLCTAAADWRNYQTFFEDFDGDGRVDLLMVHDTRARQFLGLSTGTGFEEWTWQGTEDWSDFELHFGDFDSDGKTDIFLKHEGSGQQKMGLATGAGFAMWTWETAPGYNWEFSGVDGNGCNSCEHSCSATCTAARVGQRKQCHQPGTHNNDNVYTCRSSDDWSQFELYVHDFNGDGRADLLLDHKSRNEQRLGLSTGDGFERWTWNGAQNWRNHDLHFADFNGDEKIDVFLKHRATGTHRLALSTGARGFEQGAWQLDPGFHWDYEGVDNNGCNSCQHGCSAACTASRLGQRKKCDVAGTHDNDDVYRCKAASDWSGYDLYAQDVNGDGRSDLVLKHRTGAGLRLALSTGDGFQIEPWSWESADDWSAAELRFSDFDGDGKADPYLRRNAEQRIGRLHGDWQSSLPGGLVQTRSRLGAETSIEYLPSSLWTNTFMPAGMILHAVSSLTTTDGRGLENVVTRSYSGGLWHPPHREFLGFREMEVSQQNLGPAGYFTAAEQDAASQMDRTTRVVFTQQVADQVNSVESSYRYDRDGNLLAARGFVFERSGDGVATPYVSHPVEEWSDECNADASCRRRMSQSSYDEFGQQTHRLDHGDVDTAGDERVRVTTYAPNTADYLVGFPSQTTFFSGLDESGAILRSERFYYDGSASPSAPPSQGLLHRAEAWLAEESRWVTRSWTYDDRGNPTSFSDETGHTTTTVYDTTYAVFPEIVTNALGQSTTTLWDARCGVWTDSTDANQQVTTRDFDPHCRQVGENRPDGSYTLWEFLHQGDPESQHVRRAVSDGSADGLWHETYFDGLGRPYESVAEPGYATAILYHPMGGAWRTSAPYDASEAPAWTSRYFDALDRLVLLVNADGSSSETVYDDWLSVSYDELGVPVEHHYDGYGRLRRTVEHAGAELLTTDVAHDLMGRVVSVTDAHGNWTSARFDTLGRKIEMDDPDLGPWSMAYDDAGRLVRAIDARGTVVDTDYDALGRVTEQRAGGTVLARFRYDEVRAGYANVGRRTSSETAAVASTMDYDAMGRRVADTRDIGGDRFESTRSFDLAGRLEQSSQPDGTSIQYSFDAAGRVNRVEASRASVGQSFPPSDDAHVRAGSYADTNYGASKTLRVQWTHNPDARARSETYMKFDLSGYAGSEVAVATLELSQKTAETGSIAVVAVPHDGWSEEGLTWSNRPAQGAIVRTVDVSGGDRQFIDVTDYVNQELAGDRVVSIALQHAAASGSGRKRLRSREHHRVQDRPALTLGAPAAATVVSDAAYDARDRLTSLVLGNGVRETYTYDPDRLWLETATITRGASVIDELIYTRDARGELIEKYSSVEPENRWTYTYDDLRRLTRAENQTNPALSEAFSYDAIGNVLTSTRTGAYDYPGAGQRRPHAPEAVGGVGYSYDLNGNRLSDGTHDYSYDALNRVASVDGTPHGYDAAGRLVSVGDLIMPSPTYELKGGRSTTYVMLGRRRVARLDSTGRLYFYHADHLGTVHKITDRSGEEASTRLFSSYGESLTDEGVADPFGIGGQRLLGSGLYHMGARYMDPAAGQFTQPDPSDAPDPARPQSLNRYAYVLDNPVRYIDPTGYREDDMGGESDTSGSGSGSGSVGSGGSGGSSGNDGRDFSGGGRSPIGGPIGHDANSQADQGLAGSSHDPNGGGSNARGPSNAGPTHGTPQGARSPVGGPIANDLTSMTEQGYIGPRSNAAATGDFDRYNPQNWGNTKEEGRKLGQLVADAGRRMSTGRSFMDDAMPQAIEAGILGLVEEKSEEFQEGFQEGLSQAYGSRYNSSAPPDELFGRAQGWPGAPMPPGTPGVPMPSMPR